MKNLIYTIMIAGLSASASAADVKLNLNTGYDSNPFRLSDNFSVDSAAFVSLGARFKQTFSEKRTYLKGNIKSRLYESSADDANETKGQISLGYLNSFEGSKKRYTYRLEGKYTIRDKSYVSRLTGAIGSFGGQSLKDRYDYQQGGIKGKISARVIEKLKAAVSLEYQERDYENFSIAGLSDLDYSSFLLANSWDYGFDKRRQVGAEVSYSRRNYDNRRAKNSTGATLSGTNLTYDYYGLILDYKFHLAPYTDVKLVYDFNYRKDNGGGYYDSRSHIARVKAEYHIFEWAYFESQLAYKNTSYLKEPDPIDVANDEELTSKEGYTLKLSYRQSMEKLTGYKLYVGASIQQDDIGSDNKFYDYDRQRIILSLKGEF